MVAPLRARTLLAAQVLFVLVLSIVWMCTLGELVMSEAALCIAPDAPAGCAESNPALTARNALWLVPVLVGGPLIAAAAWLALTPRGQRNAPACVLFSFIWLCAAPALFLDAHSCTAAVDRYCGSHAPIANVLKEVAASVGLVGGPVVLAAIAYRSGRRNLGRVFAVAAFAAMVLVLVKTAAAIIL
ncbi:hypothetical protein O1R50_02005 [Glycomyces luteolus]|uniref:Uncharacterized protein n=1 Tax=Glycomyces luteolus TaxID=2670330 RepID=A0A9X3P5D2_9ACTN|nr:hypothetical protein [Glycomyces luteolus]MDA1358374.1 hypothetical protein [Glycomyces luteolus]